MPLARLLLLGAIALAAPASAQLTGDLVQRLKQGGYVLVMRHATSPDEPPDAATADRANPQHERQLNDKGRADATAFGAGLRSLGIPIGVVQISPTYRTRQTARFAGLTQAVIVPQLAERGSAVAPKVAAKADAWLRQAAARSPKPGTNTLLITHRPNISAAFPQAGEGMAAGEALVLRPGAGSTPVARIKIEEWRPSPG